jgi:hypothetical protein
VQAAVCQAAARVPGEGLRAGSLPWLGLQRSAAAGVRHAGAANHLAVGSLPPPACRRRRAAALRQRAGLCWRPFWGPGECCMMHLACCMQRGCSPRAGLHLATLDCRTHRRRLPHLAAPHPACRRARSGLRRTPQGRLIARGSTLTTGTAWTSARRPSCLRSSSEGAS